MDYFCPMVLVTGATGFVGSWLICHLLENGKQVRAMKRVNSSTKQFDQIYELYFSNKTRPKNDSLIWVNANLNDIFSIEDVMIGCDAVYHTAALVSFHKKDRRLLIESNVAGTTNVVNAMLSVGIKKMIYISSTAALGKPLHGEMIDEKTPWNDGAKNSAYAKSKHKAELEVWRGVEEGLNAIIVNPGVISGFGDWSKGSCATYKKIHDGLNLYSLGVNGIVDVRDICRAILELEAREIYNEKFVLVAENLTYQDYFNKIAKGFQLPVLKYEVKNWHGRIISRAASILENIGFKKMFVTSEIALAAVSVNEYDSSKIKDKLNFKFTLITDSVEYSTKAYSGSQKNRVYFCKKFFLLDFLYFF